MSIVAECAARQDERVAPACDAKAQDHESSENRRLGIDVGLDTRSIPTLDAQPAIVPQSDRHDVAPAQQSRQWAGTINDEGHGQLHGP
ncbi:MAG: hypothetical protein QMD73_03970 [Rhodocyclaceae bacterium]|nr:hypothetical protein [Rhodocyclaceae bacterium]